MNTHTHTRFHRCTHLGAPKHVPVHAHACLPACPLAQNFRELVISKLATRGGLPDGVSDVLLKYIVDTWQVGGGGGGMGTCVCASVYVWGVGGCAVWVCVRVYGSTPTVVWVDVLRGQVGRCIAWAGGSMCCVGRWVNVLRGQVGRF